jgi:phage gpG-like protein
MDSVEVGTNVAYAAIHQFGGKTKPRVIQPKNGKALFWPGAAHPVQSVNHPGSTIPARPFLPDESGLDWAEIESALTRYLV